MGRGSDSGEENGSLRKPWPGWYVLIELICYRIIRYTKQFFYDDRWAPMGRYLKVIRDFHGQVTENYD